MTDASCPICASNAKPDLQAHAELALHLAPKTYSILRCSGCGLRWLSPYPSPDDYQSIYDHDYYESEQPGGGGTYRDDTQRLIPYYLGITARFRSFGITSGLIDVGCGTGDFLLSARNSGITGNGVEPSFYAANKAKEHGLLVTHGMLSDICKSGDKFSAAHCSHVLEHVPDVNEFLEQLKLILEPGAPIYLEVPRQFDGILDWINRLRGQHRDYSDYSIHHHYFFTPDALQRVLKKHGFEIVSLTTYLPHRRSSRKPGIRKWGLHSLLWTADYLFQRGDVISVWARRER